MTTILLIALFCYCVAFVSIWFILYVPIAKKAAKRLDLLAEESAKRQEEIDEHFSALLEAESRIRELESLVTKSSSRSEGYSGIITKLLDSSRKASDEYEKVRRQKT